MKRLIIGIAVGMILGCLAWLAVGRLGPAVPAEPSLATRQADLADEPIADALTMPIFGAARTPTPQTVAAPVPAGDLKLVGIAFTPRRRAALLSRGGGAAFWLSTGQSKDGVTVDRLGRTAVELLVDGAPLRLELFKAARPQVVAPPSATPSSGPLPTAPPGPRGREPASAPPEQPRQPAAPAPSG
jgi:hypothetical protein